MIIHTVQPGETAYSIALEYGVSMEMLRINNGLDRAAKLAVGQALLILIPAQTHMVGLNETLYSISRRYHIPLRTLYQNNLILGGRDTIWPGQVLVLSYTEKPVGDISVNGYAYPFISQSLLNQTASYLTYLTPFTYGIASDGSLVPLEDELLLQTANRYQVSSLMHLSSLAEDGHFSSELAHMILSDQNLQERLIESVLDNLQQKGYDGLDVDFEFLGRDYQDAYVDFIAALHSRLQPYGYLVYVALAPKTWDDQPGDLYEGHDYARLGAVADGVLLMTYEWGYTYGPPMAVAPIDAVQRVLNYAVTRIPPKKIFMGIPNYGYDWPLPYIQGVTKAQSISNVYAVELAVRHGATILFDETAQTPYFTYQASDGSLHEVWFEDPRSIYAKLSLVNQYGFQGAGYWNMMRPFPANWALLNAMFRIRDAH